MSTQLEDVQNLLVKEILLLPDDLLEEVLQTSRRRLIEEMVMHVGDATQYSCNRKTTEKIQQDLFRTFLSDIKTLQ